MKMQIQGLFTSKGKCGPFNLRACAHALYYTLLLSYKTSMKRRTRYKIIDRGLIEFYRRAGEGEGANCVSSRRVHRCLLRNSRGNAAEELSAVSAHLHRNFLSAPQTDGITEGAVKYTHLFRSKCKTAAARRPVTESSSSGSFVLSGSSVSASGSHARIRCPRRNRARSGRSRRAAILTRVHSSNFSPARETDSLA